MIVRELHHRLKTSLEEFPGVVLIGPRQVGKTTLAKSLIDDGRGIYLDLERPSHRAQMNDPELFLRQVVPGLTVIDEVQHAPGLFEVLRGVIDDDRRPGRFLLLGSASPDLLRQSAETLAGRVDVLELEPLTARECGDWARLWWRGGFPDAFLARSDAAARRWQSAFLHTWVERDLPALGVRVEPLVTRRFLDMVSTVHGQTWNGARIACSLGVSQPAVARYRHLLERTWVLRMLPPFHHNPIKRMVRSPKIYVRDSGLLHALLRVPDRRALLGHSVVGSSFESLIIEQVIRQHKGSLDFAFWRSRGGAEIDLVLHRGGRPVAVIEIKHSAAPKLTRGFHQARADLGDPPGLLVHPGVARWPVTDGVEAVGPESLHEALDAILGNR